MAESIFNKVPALRPATLLKKRFWHRCLLKKRFWHRCFPVNFAKFLRTLFLTEHLWWLLLAFCKIYQDSVFTEHLLHVWGTFFLASSLYLTFLVTYWLYRVTITSNYERMNITYDMRVLKKEYKVLIFFWSFSYMIFLHNLLK